MSKVKAIYEGQIIAESDQVIEVEGNYYFPKDDVNFSFLDETETSTHCPWKGDAGYYSVKVDGKIAKDGCWYYPKPTDEARRIKDHYAFWGDIKVIKESEKERLENICTSTVKFFKSLAKNTMGADKKCPKVPAEVQKYLSNLSRESLTYSIPVDFLNNLSFFNFHNSTNACFHTNHKHEIQITNPTFNWAFDHIGKVEGVTLKDLLGNFQVLDDDLESYMKTLESHGWVKIPKVRIVKDNKNHYYSIDIAITRHGDLDHLKGLQGQFIEITREVELNQSVEDLLNNAGQGFLSFCSNYVIQEKYSKICEDFFGKEISQLSAIDLLFESEEKRASQKELYEMIFDGLSDIDTLEELMAKEIQVNDRYLQIDYRWIEKNENNLTSRMMLILTDITKQKELEDAIQKDNERQESIIKVVTDREGYLDMLGELKEIFTNIETSLTSFESSKEFDKLFRYYHTIKGGCAVYAFGNVVTIAHNLENHLTNFRDNPTEYSEDNYTFLKEMTLDLNEAYSFSIKEMNQLLDIKEDDEKRYSISESELKKIESLVKPENTELLQEIKHIKMDSIVPVLKKFESSVLSLAEQLNKEVKVDIHDDGVLIDKEKYQNVLAPLIHIVRNSVDHGIEDSDTRAMSGKEASGHISMRAFDEEDCIVIEFQDDGQGIDKDRMKNLALSKEIVDEKWCESASDIELVELIFHPGFSSKEEVSEISGRGVGMDAVKSSVEEFGGSVEVTTELGEGSVFKIKLPKAS